MSSDKTDFSLGRLFQDVKAHIDTADTLGHPYPGDRSVFELLKRVVEFLGSLNKISDVDMNMNTNTNLEMTCGRCDNTAALQGLQQQ